MQWLRVAGCSQGLSSTGETGELKATILDRCHPGVLEATIFDRGHWKWVPGDPRSTTGASQNTGIRWLPPRLWRIPPSVPPSPPYLPSSLASPRYPHQYPHQYPINTPSIPHTQKMKTSALPVAFCDKAWVTLTNPLLYIRNQRCINKQRRQRLLTSSSSGSSSSTSSE